MSIKLHKPFLEKLRKSEFSIALSTTGFVTGIHLLAGILINKIIAIKIGPSGIALLGQFTNFRDLMTNAATGSFGQGVTKYIADPDYDEKQVISTSLLFSLGFSSVFSILIISFARSLSIKLLGVSDYKFVFYIFGCALSFFAVNNILLAIINGKRKYALLAKVKITNSLVALVISVLLCWFFELGGALTALALNTTIVLLISLLLIYLLKENFLILKFSYWNNQVLKKLLGFTIMALTSALLGPLVQLYLRGYIIENASQFDAGLWESMKRVSLYYNQVITISLGVYYLPKLSSLKSSLDLKQEILKGIKIVMPLFILIAFLIYILRVRIIFILFSNEFSQMESLFFPQLIGDFFMILSYMVAYLLLAKAMVKTFVSTQLIMATSRIFFSTILFNKLGIEGVIWANALNYFIYSLVIFTIFRKILFSR